MIDVTLLGPLAETAGTRKTQATAATIAELIDVLTTRFGRDFKKRAKVCRIVVNGTPVQFVKGRKTQLNPGDEVAFLVAVGGG